MGNFPWHKCSICLFLHPMWQKWEKNFRVKRDKSNERLVLNIGHNSSFCTKALPHSTGAMLLFEPMNRVFHAQSYKYSEFSIFKSLFRIIPYYQQSLDTIGISEKLHVRMAKRFWKGFSEFAFILADCSQFCQSFIFPQNWNKTPQISRRQDFSGLKNIKYIT